MTRDNLPGCSRTPSRCALLIATVGVSGLLTCTVAARTPEVGGITDPGLRQGFERAIYQLKDSGPGRSKGINPAQRLAIEFNSEEARLQHPYGNVFLRLRGYGYGQRLLAPSKATPSTFGNRVDYHRGELSEWYLNGSRGLEQGFTLARRPGSARAGEPLVIALAVAGDFDPELGPEGDAVVLQSGKVPILRYAGLRAWDASGRTLSSRLEVGPREIRLLVDDRGAQYPLVVDPIWTQLAELIAPDGAANDNFGVSVAISGDTAVIGAPGKTIGANQNQGAAYVFVRSGNTWTEQQELTASDATPGDYFGISVAVSGDTAVVGASLKTIAANQGQGQAYVFVRNGTTWTQQQRLIAADAAAGDYFGFSVAVSGDTAVVGAPGKTLGFYQVQGAAYVFLRTGATWTQQQKLTSSDGLPGDFFGGAVAVDGDTAVIGAYKKVATYLDQGVAYIFARSGGAWTQRAELLSPEGAPNAEFGHSVAVSGSTALVGALTRKVPGLPPSPNGAGYVFVQNASTWSLQWELFPPDEAVGELFGYSVSLSGDTAAVGAPPNLSLGSQAGPGEAYVFVRSGNSWRGGMGLFAPVQQPNGGFGSAVAVGVNTTLAGANLATIGSNSNQGAAYVFGAPSGVPYVFLQLPDGTIAVWTLAANGRQLLISNPQFPAGASTGITLADAADLNGDGIPDLILQFTDGSIGVWYVNEFQLITGFAFISGPIAGWRPAGVADLDGDGHPDLIIQSTVDGSIGVWYLGGTLGNQIQGFAPISGPLAGWRVVGMADLNQDGHPDTIIQHTNGSAGVWYMGGAQGNQIQSFAVLTGPSIWSVVGTSDLDGDGHPDLMIRNTDGTLGVWYLGGAQGNQITGFDPITTPGNTDWKELGAH